MKSERATEKRKRRFLKCEGEAENGTTKKTKQPKAAKQSKTTKSADVVVGVSGVHEREREEKRVRAGGR